MRQQRPKRKQKEINGQNFLEYVFETDIIPAEEELHFINETKKGNDEL